MDWSDDGIQSHHPLLAGLLSTQLEVAATANAILIMDVRRKYDMLNSISTADGSGSSSEIVAASVDFHDRGERPLAHG